MQSNIQLAQDVLQHSDCSMRSVLGFQFELRRLTSHWSISSPASATFT